jgi:hypothetical protein
MKHDIENRYFLPPADYAKRQAERIAALDYQDGMPCNSARYYARPGSAWSTWYETAYKNAADVKSE